MVRKHLKIELSDKICWFSKYNHNGWEKPHLILVLGLSRNYLMILRNLRCILKSDLSIDESQNEWAKSFSLVNNLLKSALLVGEWCCNWPISTLNSANTASYLMWAVGRSQVHEREQDFRLQKDCNITVLNMNFQGTNFWQVFDGHIGQSFPNFLRIFFFMAPKLTLHQFSAQPTRKDNALQIELPYFQRANRDAR